MTLFSPSKVIYQLDDPSNPFVALNDGAAVGVARHGFVFAGTDGTTARFFKTRGDGTQIHMPLVDAISLGLISGATVGYINGIEVTGTDGKYRQIGEYTDIGAATKPKIVSAGSNDAGAGTGLQQARLTYFTSPDGTNISGPFTEDITLVASSAVDFAAADVRFVERLQGIRFGSGGKAALNVRLRRSDNTDIALIPAGDRAASISHHFVPSGKTCIIHYLHVRNVAAAYLIYIATRDPFNANSSYRVVSGQYGTAVTNGPANWQNILHQPIKVIGPTQVAITMRCQTPGPGAAAFVNAGYYEF